MKNTMISNQEALSRALAYVEISAAESRCEENRPEDGFYYIEVSTLLLRYEFYVDASTGEVMGANTEPATCPELAFDESAPEKKPARAA